MNDHWNVLYQVTVFYADRKSKMAAIAGHRLTLDPMGKCSNAFFSETTNMIKAKLYMNVHWTVLYNLKVFCSDMKFKMAATAPYLVLTYTELSRDGLVPSGTVIQVLHGCRQLVSEMLG